MPFSFTFFLLPVWLDLNIWLYRIHWATVILYFSWLHGSPFGCWDKIPDMRDLEEKIFALGSKVFAQGWLGIQGKTSCGRGWHRKVAKLLGSGKQRAWEEPRREQGAGDGEYPSTGLLSPPPNKHGQLRPSLWDHQFRKTAPWGSCHLSGPPWASHHGWAGPHVPVSGQRVTGRSVSFKGHAFGMGIAGSNVSCGFAMWDCVCAKASSFLPVHLKVYFPFVCTYATDFGILILFPENLLNLLVLITFVGILGICICAFLL